MTLSDIVNAAVDAIWLSFDPETIGRGLDILQQEADAGDPDADAVLAMAMIASDFHWVGSGVHVTYSTAINHLRRSIDGGSALGATMAVLANIDLNGIVNSPANRFTSIAEAFEEVADYAAASGSGLCHALLGCIEADDDLYCRIYPEEKEKKGNVTLPRPYTLKALDDLEKACDAGFSAGLNAYGCLIKDPGMFSQPRFTAYRRHIDRLVDSGNPEAMRIKADELYNDALMDPDWAGWPDMPHPGIAKAVALYRSSADAGDIIAMSKLAWIYYERDERPDETFDLFSRAENRREDAILGSALCIYEGRGIEADISAALRKFRSAYSNTGDPRAAALLGVIYQTGTDDIPSDDETAFRYLRLVEDKYQALLLSDRAKGAVANALGTAYAFGRGTAQDIEKGVGYLDRAIEYGDDNAPANRRRFVKTIFGWKQKY